MSTGNTNRHPAGSPAGGQFVSGSTREGTAVELQEPDVTHLLRSDHSLADWELELADVTEIPVVTGTDADQDIVEGALWYSSRVLWGPDADPDPDRLGRALVPVRQAIVFYGPDSHEATWAARDFINAHTTVPGWNEQSPEQESEWADDSARDLVQRLSEPPAHRSR